MTWATSLLLIIALICANLPFTTQKWFGMMALVRKRFWHHLLELALGFLFVAGLAYFLEAQNGSVQPQHWQFYVVVVCLYLILAFPGFVLCYFWHSRHQQ